MWMGVSWVLDAVGQKPSNLYVEVVRVKCELAKEATVAAAGFVFVVAVVDALVPYNAVPILSLHLADFHHPFQRKPWESCMVVYHHLMRFSTCPALSYAAPSEVTPVSFSLPLAFAYLPRLSRAANFACFPLHLATAVEELEVVPWVGSKEVGQEELVVVVVGVMS